MLNVVKKRMIELVKMQIINSKQFEANAGTKQCRVPRRANPRRYTHRSVIKR